MTSASVFLSDVMFDTVTVRFLRSQVPGTATLIQFSINAMCARSGVWTEASGMCVFNIKILNVGSFCRKVNIKKVNVSRPIGSDRYLFKRTLIDLWAKTSCLVVCCDY